jgi:hypothetical protein
MPRTGCPAFSALDAPVKPALHYLAGLFRATPGEMLGALASILGGIIGALGAAAAVFLMLNRQRKDEREKISSALLTEVMEFCRLAVGHLQTCENIEAQKISIPKADFPSVMQMPKPTIYATAADQIGRLRAPQWVVSFYTRISEIETLIALVAAQPAGAQPHVTNVTLIAHAWMDVCRFGKWIIEEKPIERNLNHQLHEHVLRDLQEALEKAERRFPEG